MKILDRYRKSIAQWRHWLTVILMIGVGMIVGGYLDDKNWWIDQRYEIYQHLTNLNWQRPQPRDTFVVLIGDEEFWNLDLARRIPLKRDYLARLIQKLDSANPQVIALDFDMRSPFPDGSLIEHSDYRYETAQLVEAIKAASEKRSLVLGATFYPGEDGQNVLDPDIFLDANFNPRQVSRGFIQLAPDVRQVPLRQPLRGAGEIASFAEAIVRASSNSKALENVPRAEALPYGEFMEATAWESSSAYAADVLAGDPALMKRISCKIVLIGGAWHPRAKKRGERVDVFRTPVGKMDGVYIHANYVEALSNRRTRTSNEYLTKTFEFFGALAVALLFRSKYRDPIKAIFVVVACLALSVFSYFLWQNVGIFVDFFIPVVMVFLHAIVEKVLEWRRGNNYALTHKELNHASFRH